MIKNCGKARPKSGGKQDGRGRRGNLGKVKNQMIFSKKQRKEARNGKRQGNMMTKKDAFFCQEKADEAKTGDRKDQHQTADAEASEDTIEKRRARLRHTASEKPKKQKKENV